LKSEENQGWHLLFVNSDNKNDDNMVIKTIEDNTWEIQANQSFGDISSDVSCRPKFSSKYDRD